MEATHLPVDGKRRRPEHRYNLQRLTLKNPFLPTRAYSLKLLEPSKIVPPNWGEGNHPTYEPVGDTSCSYKWVYIHICILMWVCMIWEEKLLKEVVLRSRYLTEWRLAQHSCCQSRPAEQSKELYKIRVWFMYLLCCGSS